MKKAILVLENEEAFQGRSFAWEGEALGNVVINTNMMGYQEILTDPVYFNSFVVMTYPLIGNYGVNKNDMNSKKTFASGLIVKEYSKIVSNWQAHKSLADFMKEYKVFGLEGIDTRRLARSIKKDGAQKGIISTKDTNAKRLLKKLSKVKEENLVCRVSCKKAYEWKRYKINRKRAVLLDLGVSFSFLDWLTDNDLKVKVMPYTTEYEKIIKLKPEVVILSNGPGDPLNCKDVIKNIRNLIGKETIFGFGLGASVLGVALGAKSYRLKCGHHGSNYAVKSLSDKKCYITKQDHLFCLRNKSLKGENKILSINLNDGTVEGFENKRKKAAGLYYLPEKFNI